MSTIYERPVTRESRLFRLSEASLNYAPDYSVMREQIALTAPVFSSPLEYGNSHGIIFGNGSRGTYQSKIFSPGTEDVTTSISFTVDNVNSGAGAVPIFASSSGTGIYIDNGIITAIVEFNNGTFTKRLVDVLLPAAVKISISGYSIELYVNGQHYERVAIDSTLAGSGFKPGNGTITIGSTATSPTFLLSGLQINSEPYRDKLIIPELDFVTETSGGKSLDLGMRNEIENFSFPDTMPWDFGMFTNVTIADGLYSIFNDTGVTVAGEWRTQIPLQPQTGNNIYGVSISWKGDALIETSINGTTWSTTTNNSLVLLGNNPNVSDSSLHVRATFAGGLPVSQILKSLSVRKIATADIGNDLNTSVSVTYPAVAIPRPDFGLGPTNIVNTASGSLRVTSGGFTEGDRTIQLLIKKSGNITLPTGTVYVNGVTGSIPDNVWSIVHIVADSNIPKPITIPANVQVAHMALYPYPLSQAEIQQIVAQAHGVNSVRINQGDEFNVVESFPVKSFTHSWVIVSAGG